MSWSLTHLTLGGEVGGGLAASKTLTLTPRDNLESTVNSSHVFGIWEEAVQNQSKHTKHKEHKSETGFEP